MSQSPDALLTLTQIGPPPAPPASNKAGKCLSKIQRSECSRCSFHAVSDLRPAMGGRACSPVSANKGFSLLSEGILGMQSIASAHIA